MLFLILLPQGANLVIRLAFLISCPLLYISRCDPLGQRVCCSLSQEKAYVHVQLKNKEKGWGWPLLFLKKLKGKKQKVAPCSITILLHVGYCHWLEHWRSIWPSGKINYRTKFKLMKQNIGHLFGWLWKLFWHQLVVTDVGLSLWTAYVSTQDVSLGHFGIIHL